MQAERQADPQYEQNKLQHRPPRAPGRLRRPGAGRRAEQRPLPDGQQRVAAPAGVCAAAAATSARLPDYLRCQRNWPNSCSFWFGPAGTVTPLHHDTLMLFHTQIVGRKRWRFISPLETPRLYNYFDVYSPDRHRPARPAPLPRFQPGHGARCGGRAGRDGVPASGLVAPGDGAGPEPVFLVLEPGRAQPASAIATPTSATGSHR